MEKAYAAVILMACKKIFRENSITFFSLPLIIILINKCIKIFILKFSKGLLRVTR